MARRTACLFAIAAMASACTGLVEGPAAGPRGTGPDGPPPPSDITILASTAIPRLSRRELERTVADVLGVEGAVTRYLPEDPSVYVDPDIAAEVEVFDTHTDTKSPSQVFVEGLETMAFEVARELSARPADVDVLAGCTPSGAWDRACLAALVSRVGRGLWHRPLAESEVQTLVELATPYGEENGHYVAVRLVLSALLQSPELVYQSQIGQDVGEGTRRLRDHELLARLAYFFWGTAPSPELLDVLDAGPLDDEALAGVARSMIDDPRADAQIAAFHRLWLRYDELVVADASLATDMRAETDALLERALANDGTPWSTLFTADETYVTPRLAEHYGLDVPLGADWVRYDDVGRAGVLSHGSLLSLASSRGSDTRPSSRGAMIARRLFCVQILPPPPDVNPDAGVEVEPGACKEESYAVHATGRCAGCHSIIDPIGFGLERFDGLGRHRTVEEANPACAIAGRGSFAGVEFSGPRELATQVSSSGVLQRCGAEQLLRFAHRTGSVDTELVARASAAFVGSDEDFRALMLAIALDPTFRFRREAP